MNYIIKLIFLSFTLVLQAAQMNNGYYGYAYQTAPVDYEKIIKEGNVNLVDFNNETYLHKAAKEGNVDAVRALIKAGAYVNAKNKFLRTALHIVSGYQSLRDFFTKYATIANELIQSGANIDEKDYEQDTPLSLGLRCNSYPIVDLLIKAKANLKLYDKFGLTPLHIASCSGGIECLKLLLNEDINIDILDSEGNSPLMRTTHQNVHNVLQLLLKAGADISLINNKGEGVIQLIRKQMFYGKSGSKLLRYHKVLLLNECSKVLRIIPLPLPIINLISQYTVEKFKKNQIEFGVDYNQQLVFGSTLDNYNVVQEALTNEANIDFNYQGNQPLHIALQNNSWSIINQLLKANADVNKSDKDGYTPVEFAINHSFVSPEILNLLLRFGGDLYYQTNKFDRLKDKTLENYCPDGKDKVELIRKYQEYMYDLVSNCIVDLNLLPKPLAILIAQYGYGENYII